jgi:hypothetical protein
MAHEEGESSPSMSNQKFTHRGLSKLDWFIRFDEVNFWMSRTRDLISSAETFSFPEFLESFRKLRRKSRRAEFALLLALYKFQRKMEEQATDADNRKG